MLTELSAPSLLRSLWPHISIQRRRQSLLLMVLMVVASFAEVVSLGAVLPFLGVLTAPEKLFALPALQPLIIVMNVSSPSDLLLPLTLAFASAAVIAAALRLLLVWTSTKISYGLGSDLSLEIYRRTLYQPYASHLEKNTSEIIAAIGSKTSVVITSIIMPSFTIISSTVMLAAIFGALIWIAPFISLTVLGGLSLIYLFLSRLTRKKLKRNGQIHSEDSSQLVKITQEGLAGIRDVLLHNMQEIYCAEFAKINKRIRDAQISTIFISQGPRYAMEAAGILLITAVAYFQVQHSTAAELALPLLGVIALGAQKMLPMLQQLYWSLACMRGGLASLRDTLEILNQKIPAIKSITNGQQIQFQKRIKILNLGFKYKEEQDWVLKNINLTIKKGARLGIIGETGSGKSTLVDIILGLLTPVVGSLTVDGQKIENQNLTEWQAMISHVPQNIHIIDDTIENNIALGVANEKIDKLRVKAVAEQAQLANLINSLPQKYETNVGEHGSKLSGGQRQRIAIARALYRRVEILVLDEATSSLDGDTEDLVMDVIRELGDEVTVIMITHRHTTLKNATQIVKLQNGTIEEINNCAEIIN